MIPALAILMVTVGVLRAEAADPADSSFHASHRLLAGISIPGLRGGERSAENLAGHLSYRRERSTALSWTFDAFATRSEEFGASGEADPAKDIRWLFFLGPGVRTRKSSSPVRPFVQANLWLVAERNHWHRNGAVHTDTQYDPGFGVGFGLDVVLSRRVELPLGLRVDHVFRELDETLPSAEAGISFGFGP